jgi:hypothetical protein
MFQRNNRRERVRKVRAIGLFQKIEKEPPLRINDWRKASSMVGPRINARMNGARSYWNLRRK